MWESQSWFYPPGRQGLKGFLALGHQAPWGIEEELRTESGALGLGTVSSGDELWLVPAVIVLSLSEAGLVVVGLLWYN